MQEQSDSSQPARLIQLDGTDEGLTFALRGDLFRVGRKLENDLVPSGGGAERVSGLHLEMVRGEDGWMLKDLGSTNGTFVDDERVDALLLNRPCVITVGKKGPRFKFLPAGVEPESEAVTEIVGGMTISEADEEVQDALREARRASVDPDRKTGKLDESEVDEAKASKKKGNETLLREAVIKAREARTEEGDGQTIVIMRDALNLAMGRTRRTWQRLVAFLVLLLVGTCALFYFKIQSLSNQKVVIDTQINRIEKDLQEADNPEKIQALIQQLDGYQKRAKTIHTSLLYQIGAADEEEDFIKAEIRSLMRDFGAEQYSIPPEFVQQVKVYMEQYQTRDRAIMERAVGSPHLATMQEILAKHYLPGDLAYIVVVESGFVWDTRSHKGAVGPWQLVPRTARAFGLKVGNGVDERVNLEKSTHAAARYIRKLILDFGTGGSVMLAMAAYNLGPTTVRARLRKIEDPFKQRDFWYLYRTRALPNETREYIPKIFAAAIIGRNPERFGFDAGT